MFFSVHFFPPCSLTSSCPSLRSDPLQWLPALKWNSSTLGNWLWVQNCPVDHQHPAPAWQWALSFPASPVCPLSHVFALLPTYTVLTLKLNQITRVNCNRNGLLHIGLDIGIWLCTKNLSQTFLCEGSVIKLLICAFFSIPSPHKMDGHLSPWPPYSPWLFWPPPFPAAPGDGLLTWNWFLKFIFS